VASSATPLKIGPSAPGALESMTSACDGKPARDRNSADTAPRSGAAMCAKVGVDGQVVLDDLDD
jgi:hypothetical protein